MSNRSGPGGVPEAVEAITDATYGQTLSRIVQLVSLDPSPESEFGRELVHLSSAVAAYERATFPLDRRTCPRCEGAGHDEDDHGNELPCPCGGDGTDRSYTRGLERENAKFHAHVTALEAENAALRGFAGAAIKAVRGIHVGNDWDGGDVQDAMVAAGLLAPFEATESCGEDCVCAESGFPLTCYRLTERGQRCANTPSPGAPER